MSAEEHLKEAKMKKEVRANRLTRDSTRGTLAILLLAMMLPMSFLITLPEQTNAQPARWSRDTRLTYRLEGHLKPAVGISLAGWDGN